MKGIVRFISVTLAAVAVISNFSLPVSAGCVQHEFYQKYLGVATVTTSKHTVRDKKGNTVVCTITTKSHAVADVCKNCGYQAGSYLEQEPDVHSVDHY